MKGGSSDRIRPTLGYHVCPRASRLTWKRTTRLSNSDDDRPVNSRMSGYLMERRLDHERVLRILNNLFLQNRSDWTITCVHRAIYSQLILVSWGQNTFRRAGDSLRERPQWEFGLLFSRLGDILDAEAVWHWPMPERRFRRKCTAWG